MPTPIHPPDRFDELRRVAVPLLRPYAQRIAVFGSYARGEETAESDIDLLVTLKPSEQRPALGLKLFSFANELAQSLGRPVDLGTELDPYVLPLVQNELVVIYEE